MEAYSLPYQVTSEILQVLKALYEDNTGVRKQITAAKREKKWWFKAYNGTLIVNVRYGTLLSNWQRS